MSGRTAHARHDSSVKVVRDLVLHQVFCAVANDVDDFLQRHIFLEGCFSLNVLHRLQLSVSSMLVLLTGSDGVLQPFTHVIGSVTRLMSV